MKNFTALTEKELLLVEGGWGAGYVNTDAFAGNNTFNATGFSPFANSIYASNDYAAANGDTAAIGGIGAAGVGQSTAATSPFGNMSIGYGQFMGM